MLYVVPTPIGNLEDFSFRSIKILKQVDIILAENYKTSKKLLNFYNIKTYVKSYHIFNEHKITLSIIKQIINHKKTIAIISSAGTPGISDPGFLLIRSCIKFGIPIDCLPGPTALIPSLILSGFPTQEFVFVGFLPKKKRKLKLKLLSKETRTIILYESPYRLKKTLEDIKFFFGKHINIAICKEISKLFQNISRGSINDIINIYKNCAKILGEYTIIINKH